MNHYVVLLGPWGSGSSAIAGALDRLGANTCPPHWQPIDPRTPSAYEPAILREILVKHIHEPHMIVTGDTVKMAHEIQQWLESAAPETDETQFVVLKHALLCTVIPTIASLLKPKFVVIRRPYMDIERTRARRQWPELFGYFGARVLYERIYSSLVAHNMSFLDLVFPDLLSHQDRELQRLIEFVGLNPTESQLAEAKAFLRPSSGPLRR